MKLLDTILDENVKTTPKENVVKDTPIIDKESFEEIFDDINEAKNIFKKILD